MLMLKKLELGHSASPLHHHHLRRSQRCALKKKNDAGQKVEKTNKLAEGKIDIEDAAEGNCTICECHRKRNEQKDV